MYKKAVNKNKKDSFGYPFKISIEINYKPILQQVLYQL
jgi:hypothetical protein